MPSQATISKKTADVEVEMDRRRNERREDATKPDGEGTSQFNPPRRKKQRRRQIDPTTCERDYNDEEIEFMQSLDAYKRSSGRMFPTCSEILEVIRSLGYVRLTEEQLAEFVGEDDSFEDSETDGEVFDDCLDEELNDETL